MTRRRRASPEIRVSSAVPRRVALPAVYRLSRIAFACGVALLGACASLPRQDAGSASCDVPALPSSERFAFDSIDTGLPTAGQWRDGFALADMDGDGSVDVLHGPARKGRSLPVIFRGDGAGRFAPWREAHFPPLPYDYGDIQAADLNRDGTMDIAIASHLRGLATLIGEGAGHYAPWGDGLALRLPGEFREERNFTSRAIALADWNADGAIDLLALNEGPSRFGDVPIQEVALALYLNRGGYWERIASEPALSGFGDSIATGDVDGDGRIDALAGTQMAAARELLQHNTGTGVAALPVQSLPERATATAVALHDFDRDQRDELLIATRALQGARRCSGLQWIRRAPRGREKLDWLWSEATLDPIVTLLAADIDRDGNDDLIALRRDGEILLFAGNRRGFSRDGTIALPAHFAGCNAFDADVGDFDRDGHPDLLVAYAGDAAAGAFGGKVCESGGGFAAWRLSAR